jgi:ferredoxin
VNIGLVKLVYFSPTRTTESILRSIAAGLAVEPSGVIDFTLPEARAQSTAAFQGELVLLGVPVYAGRVPLDAVEYLNQLTASQTPAVPVVLYGNRAYDDALLELSDIATRVGFLPVAAGAFIGEHSFSTPEAPLAPARPDGQDAAQARAFGVRIRAKLERVDSIEELTPISVPGSFPYRERRRLFEIAPVTSAELCTQCGQCSPVCPKGAIDDTDATRTDSSECIFCCACIRACPEDARSWQDEALKGVVRRLQENCLERREPETFL